MFSPQLLELSTEELTSKRHILLLLFALASPGGTGVSCKVV